MVLESTSAEEFFNSIVHEMCHVKTHMIGIDLKRASILPFIGGLARDFHIYICFAIVAGQRLVIVSIRILTCPKQTPPRFSSEWGSFHCSSFSFSLLNNLSAISVPSLMGQQSCLSVLLQTQVRKV